MIRYKFPRLSRFGIVIASGFPHQSPPKSTNPPKTLPVRTCERANTRTLGLSLKENQEGRDRVVKNNKSSKEKQAISHQPDYPPSSFIIDINTWWSWLICIRIPAQYERILSCRKFNFIQRSFFIQNRFKQSLRTVSRSFVNKQFGCRLYVIQPLKRANQHTHSYTFAHTNTYTYTLIHTAI